MLAAFRRTKQVGTTTAEESRQRGALCFDGLRAPKIVDSSDGSSGASATVVSASNYGAIIAPSTRSELAGLTSVPADIGRSVAATASLIREHPVAGTVEWGLRARVTPTPHEGLTNSEVNSFAVAGGKERDTRLAKNQTASVAQTDAWNRRFVLAGGIGDPRAALKNRPVVPITVTTGPAVVHDNQLLHAVETTTDATEAAPAGASIQHAGAAMDKYNTELKAHIAEHLAPHMIVSTSDGMKPVPPEMLARLVDRWNEFGSDKPMLWFFFHKPNGSCRIMGEAAEGATAYDNHSVDELHNSSAALVGLNKAYVTMHCKPGESAACYPHGIVNSWLQERHKAEVDFHRRWSARVFSGAMLPGNAGVHAGVSIDSATEETEHFDPHAYVAKIAQHLADDYSEEQPAANAALAAGDLLERVTGFAGTVAGKVGDVPGYVAGGISRATGAYANAASGVIEVITQREADKRVKAMRDAGFSQDSIDAAMINVRVDSGGNSVGKKKKKMVTRVGSGDAFVLKDGSVLNPDKTMIRLSHGVRSTDVGMWVFGEECHENFINKYFPQNSKRLRKAVRSMSKAVMASWGLGSPKKPAAGFSVTEYAVNYRDGVSDEVYLPSGGYQLDSDADAEALEIGYWITPDTERQIRIDGIMHNVSKKVRLCISHVFFIKRLERTVDHFMQWTSTPGEFKTVMNYCNAVIDPTPIGRVFSAIYTSNDKVKTGRGAGWPTAMVQMYSAD